MTNEQKEFLEKLAELFDKYDVEFDQYNNECNIDMFIGDCDTLEFSPVMNSKTIKELIREDDT